MPPVGLYLHIPFCTHRCAYCDFNTYARYEHLIPAYVHALKREIEILGANAPSDLEVCTVYLGGGTPSLLSPSQLAVLLNQIRASFKILPGTETTIEANPDTVTESDLASIRELGVDRISFGAQSTNPEELRLLERTHDFVVVINAVAAARRAGFTNLNLDLIFGLPGQSVASWQRSVRRILDLEPEHVSAYGLTLEHGTPFSKWVGRGLVAAPDPDVAAEMYEAAGDELAAAGLRQYEISNWARPGRECLHNLQYWRGLAYLGLGAGAHGYWGGMRTSNVLRIATYIERMNERRSKAAPNAYPLSPSTVSHHRQSEEDERTDFMLMRLRLTSEGVPAAVFQERFGRALSETYDGQISELQAHGLVEWSENRTSEDDSSSDVLRLTKRGRLLGNQVFMRFIESEADLPAAGPPRSDAE